MILTKLTQPVSPFWLGVFRVLFGFLMLAQVRWDFQFIWERCSPYVFHFPFSFAPFIKPWDGYGMLFHYWIMGLAAFGIMIGLLYRLCMVVFFLTYTFVFLIDQTYYQNHYYLYCLLSFLMIWVDAHKKFSLDSLIFNTTSQYVPFWQIAVLRAQIVLVYFFAGIAKLDSGWLSGFTMKIQLEKMMLRFPQQLPIDWSTVAPLLSYAALFFDLSIGFLLLFQRTRVVAFVMCIFFHLFNKLMLGLDTFPWFMLASLVLFFDFKPIVQAALDLRPRLWFIVMMVLYFLWQLFLPLRHWLIPGYMIWTTEGRNFAWTMRISMKSRLHGALLLEQGGKRQMIDISKDLLPRQASSIFSNPEMLFYYVQYLKQRYEKQGIKNPKIFADVVYSMNGSPYQYFIDPRVDLASAKRPLFGHAHWITDYVK